MPKVSVILSTFNGEKYLGEALTSVLNNGFQDLEFLVVDDGSCDGSLGVLRKFAKNDSRLKVYSNQSNRGTGYSFSFLLSQVSGDYVAAIGQDDRWEPGFLQACVALLEGQPDVAVAFSDVQIIGSQGESLPEEQNPFHMDYLEKMPREDLMVFLVKFNFLCAGAAVFRSPLLRDWHTLGDNDQLQDWNMWQHMILMGAFRLVPMKLVSYRVHGNNLSLGSRSPMQVKVELWQTRLDMIGSCEFANFILASPNPNALFFTAMTAYSELIQRGNSMAYFGLLQALRKNEHLFRELDSFRDVMAMLFLHAGSLLKARRYTRKTFSALQCPPNFWREFVWKYFIATPRACPDLPISPFIRLKTLGPLKIVRVLLPRANSPSIIGFLHGKKNSLEGAIEWFLYKLERRKVRYY